MKEVVLIFLVASSGFIVPAEAAYVPDMSCHEVGGFAQTVVDMKNMGSSLQEQIDGLRTSVGGEYNATEKALEKILRALYQKGPLSTASADAVGKAYEKACFAYEATEQ